MGNERRQIGGTVLIITVTILMIAIAFGVFALFHYNSSEMTSEGGTVNKNKSVTFTSNANYKNQFLTLNVKGSNLKSNVIFYVKNPKGEVLDQGTINIANPGAHIDTKYIGEKGTWKVEFQNVTDDEEITYDLNAVSKNGDGKKTK